MDPALIYGPYGAIALLVYAVIWLAKRLEKKEAENNDLRDESMVLLKKYQDRDEEERRWRLEQERRHSEGRT